MFDDHREPIRLLIPETRLPRCLEALRTSAQRSEPPARELARILGILLGQSPTVSVAGRVGMIVDIPPDAKLDALIPIRSLVKRLPYHPQEATIDELMRALSTVEEISEREWRGIRYGWR